MCFWGEALVLGPNINAVMDASAVPEAWAALQKALQNQDHLGAPEKAYIRALSERYAEDPPADRSTLDRNYAAAMRRLAARYPDDLHAATLFAEALMDTTPWDSWTEDNEPRPVTTEFLGVLESVLRRDPGHVGANHLLIHTVEKTRPDLGIPSAERLEHLAEGAGHLVHMGAHIFLRVGRYSDAVRVNQKAIAADERFAEQHQISSVYGFLYGLHNHHFLAAAAGFQGNKKLAVDASSELRRRVDPAQMRQPGMLTGQHYWVTPYFTAVRFGMWDEILAEPEPAADLIYPRAVWHYARGMAFARTGRLSEATQEFEQVEASAADDRLDAITVWDLNTTRALMAIGARVLAGELAAAHGNFDAALPQLEAAVRLEDALTYDEPPPWLLPVRLSLGSILLEAHRPKEAESVFREDLAKYPENIWSLRGLATSLALQKRGEEEKETLARLARALKHADVEPATARY
jgi:tetratricopeptide (TPR) repeat protein